MPLTAAKPPLALRLRWTMAYRFASEAFEDGPELLFLTSDLGHNPKAVQFISTFGCEPYFHYSEQLMFQENESLCFAKSKTILCQKRADPFVSIQGFARLSFIDHIQSLPSEFLRIFGPIRRILRSSI